jgi:hypothetical protein
MFWQELMRLFGVKLNMSTAMHPQTDGQTETANRVVEQMLRHYVSYSQEDWDQYLDVIELAYNSSVHSTIGMTPFYMDTGREVNDLFA